MGRPLAPALGRGCDNVPMTADSGVRPARPEDAAAIGRVQYDAWHSGYAGILPAAALDALRTDALAQRWAAATAEPPTPHHRVLVAVSEGRVDGFCALGPATDADRDPGRDAELYTLLVDPSRQREGHGSRLLAATAQILVEEGFDTMVTWVFSADEPLANFLTESGWAPDGARRELAADETADETSGAAARTLLQQRWHTALA
jgi:GNAT superfamily N-acetyltransferase